MKTTRCHTSARRRGSSYIMIIGVSMILMVIGLSVATVARINTRNISADNDWAEAQTLAFSGAEHALTTLQATADWRTKFAGGETAVNMGRGTFRWSVVDEIDGSLDDDSGDPFTIIARGTVNGAAYAVGLNCAVEGAGMAALKTCAHSGGKMDVDGEHVLTVTGAPVSTNRKLTVDKKAVLNGDVEAEWVSDKGKITGTVTAPADAKALPDENVFEMYRKMATEIHPGRKIEKTVLAPGLNPWGKPNPQGVYYIDYGHDKAEIKNARIHGTLVVRCKTLKIKDNVLMHSYRSDYPVLIVDGDLELSLKSDSDLDEKKVKVNLNPPGAPYDGLSDTDGNDTYPSEIRGLVHVMDDLKMKGTTRVRGVIICNDKAKFEDGNNEIIHDPKLYDHPPLGYTSDNSKIVPQGWKRVVK